MSFSLSLETVKEQTQLSESYPGINSTRIHLVDTTSDNIFAFLKELNAESQGE